ARVLENAPNVTLPYVIQALPGVKASAESSSTQERAFATKRKNFRIKRRFNGKCFYCKKSVHKVFEWRKKKAHDRCGHVAQAQASDIAFTTESAMTKSAWHVNSSASSHITSVWDKFVSMKD
ncbi:hypothetical protein L915_07392, partial [Phytophthora nicotianae]